MAIWNKATTDAALRIVLRSVPFLPGPEIYDLIRSVGASERDLDRQIKDAFDALSKSSNLVDSLEKMLRERQARLVALQAEYDRTSQLSKITQAQATAIANSLEIALGKAAGRERLVAFAINIAAGLVIFIFGVVASDWIKGIANHFKP